MENALSAQWLAFLLLKYKKNVINVIGIDQAFPEVINKLLLLLKVAFFLPNKKKLIYVVCKKNEFLLIIAASAHFEIFGMWRSFNCIS